MTAPFFAGARGGQGSLEELRSYLERIQAGRIPFRRILLQGPIFHSQRSVSAAATELELDDVVIADATGAAFNFTLLTAAARKGRHLVVKRINAGANAVTIVPAGAETIDGAANLALGAQWAIARLESDGANWLTV